MDIVTHKEHWDTLGRLDPFWAILSGPDQKFGRWDPAAFFATGEAEIAGVIERVTALHSGLRFERALDFGCGVGRLTRALAQRFAHCDGVDISEEMVSRARQLNASVTNARFHVNTDSLSMFEAGTFDFIYTSIVLQHIPDREVIRGYLREFMRVLRPGGVLVFQLPANIPLRSRLQLRARLFAWLLAAGANEKLLYEKLKLQPIRMNWIPELDVRRTLEAAQGEILDAEVTAMGRRGHLNAVYVVTRRD